jgi:hypothetical protein
LLSIGRFMPSTGFCVDHVVGILPERHLNNGQPSIDNQPRRNALTRQMLSKLGGLWDELERAASF